MKHHGKTITLIMIVAAMLTLCGCTGKSAGPFSKTGLYFDTVVSIDIYGCKEDPDAILDECMDMCKHYEDLFDKNIPTSDIARINSGTAQTLSVDHDTAVLISEALTCSSLSGGRFDITINPVSSLWDFHEGSENIPAEKDLEAALTHVDFNNIEADTQNNTVTVKADGVSVDVGGAAKGYIADRIADHLSQCPVSGAIINMGGDIKLVGSKADGSLFNIGIKDPNDPASCISSVYLSDMAVATSGTYERSFFKDGVLYHHILDVADGFPVDTDVTSVTIITKNAVASDCLCTVCIILGSDDALKLIEDTDDTEAVFILTDSSMKKTSGADAYIRK